MVPRGGFGWGGEVGCLRGGKVVEKAGRVMKRWRDERKMKIVLAIRG